jgi:membrane protease YdiL (CAAX protease family)
MSCEAPVPTPVPPPGPSSSVGTAPSDPPPEAGLPEGLAGATAPPRRTHRWGIGAYILVEAVFVGVSLLIGLAFRGERLSVVMLTLALAVPTVLAAAVALLVTRLRGNGPRTDLGLVWSWRDVRLGAAYGFGGLVVTVPASLLYAALVGPGRASSAVGDVFGGLRAGPVAAVGVALVVVLLAPLCEEIVYRGLLWGAVSQRWGRWAALIVSTVVFAIAHLEWTRIPLLLIVALPIGLARLYAGNLTASIVAHQVTNLLPGLALMFSVAGVAPAA